MNLGSIVFNAKDGAQLEVYPNSQTTIKAWDIAIGSKQSFDNLNLDSMQDGLEVMIQVSLGILLLLIKME